MRDFKYGLYLFGISLIGYIVVESYRYVLPFVAEDEYYIYKTTLKDDKNISWKTIHSKNCPYEKSAWFTIKHNLYDIILEEDAYICKECFDEDEAKKLLILHSINLETLYKRYKRYQRRGELSEDDVDSLMRRWNSNANLREVYYLD